ncbi:MULTISPECIES: calcium/sodium antiporter [Crateriforma]|uniref:Inner membrane protein YrbG n=1 Tax=Crateriforma conspicua TaxID=2527996 RepID=A0A5C6FM73_9PLAN|nr:MULTISPECIES: calcium/sodium antiporter [Crateriforma]TWU60939.1 Inner membrane protein YrbG [Crateriforma conspicua]
MFLTILALLAGGVLLVLGGELVVRGASQLAFAARLSPLFVGLTVVSFGTSAPELAVSVLTALQGQADITVGNVIGSNLFNLLMIVGLSAAFVPLEVRSQVVKFDLPVMIAAAVLMYLLSDNLNLSRIDGCVFLIFLFVYFTVSFRLGRRQFESDAARDTSQTDSDDSDAAAPVDDPSSPLVWRVIKNLFILAVGITLLVVGCRLFVDASVAIAQRFGMSEALIGLTIVSVGTSLPELVTSVMASLKGQRSIAIGNAVGSTTLNILAVLGVTAVVAPAGIPVAEKLFASDLPMMIGSCVLIWPLFATSKRVSRLEGLFLLLVYAAYMAYLIYQQVSQNAVAVPA